MKRDPAMGEPHKRLTRMRYDQGPMGFLADQIMKEMQRAGYPSREFNLYRSPDVQRRMVDRGVSKVGPYDSAHQFYGASDIIHEKWAWFASEDAPDGTQFWGCLWDCVEVVGEKFRVKFKPRIGWDQAHVELANWTQFREVIGHHKPTQIQLDWYFAVTLPAVWKQHLRSQTLVA